MTDHGERVLVVAAHPDDEVLGCGGAIAWHTDRGHGVRVLFLAEGVTARFPTQEMESPKVKAASAQRNANALRALAILGVPATEVLVSARPCCRLDQAPQIDLVKDIEHQLVDWRPTRLFTHAGHDANVDHRLAHAAVIAAVRPVRGTPVRSVLTMEVLSSTEWNPTQPFPALVFADITEQLDRKVRALAAYGDEMRDAPHPRSEAVLRALATYRGAQIGVRYAEGFGVIRATYP